MKARQLVLYFLALCVLGACGAGTPLPPPKVAEPLGSRVELASGNVWLRDGEDSIRLISGAMLPRVAKIHLDEGARALVRLSDGTSVFLRGGSVLEVNESALHLAQGEMWVDVPAHEDQLGQFTAGKIQVSAAGTGFDLLASEGQVQVYVSRGLAVVAAPGGRSEVQTGEKVVVSGEERPQVTPVRFWEDWTGGMADRALSAGIGGKGSGRIYGLDRTRPGSAPKELQVLSQEVRTVIREGIAHTTVDQRFFNPASVDVEGWYWFTVPEGASVERFALDMNGYLIEGEMVERTQAATAYEEAVRKAIDPALLEWVDERTFRARIFPIPRAGERRVVLSYTQSLPFADGAYRYLYPMGSQGDARIQEFSLQVILGDEGADYEISTLHNARVEEDSSMVSIRRSGFLPRSDFLLELRPLKKVLPLRVARFSTGKNEADYVMIRYAPDVDWESIKDVPGDVVVVMDTSAGGSQAERQVRADAVEAILRALSDGDRFAVVAADLKPKVVFPATGLSEATDANVSKAMESLSEIVSAGATDLGEMFHVAFDLLHESEQPAVVYVGDGRPTVGETTSMALTERLRRSLGGSRARLFTIAVGSEANHPLLERISTMGGGRSFRIDTPEQAVQEALRFTGLVKTPTITQLEIDAGAGLDQAFTTVAGKVSEGEEILLLARSHHELPKTLRVRGRLGGKDFEKSYPVKAETGEDYGYIPSLWARMYLSRLMGEGATENRGRIISLGLSYALMTPFTSFLVLESDQAYWEAGIQRRQRSHIWKGFEGGGTNVADGAVAAPVAAPDADEAAPPEAMMMEAAAEESYEPPPRLSRAKKSARPEPAPPSAPKPSARRGSPVERRPSTASKAEGAPTRGRPSALDDLHPMGGASGLGSASGLGGVEWEKEELSVEPIVELESGRPSKTPVAAKGKGKGKISRSRSRDLVPQKKTVDELLKEALNARPIPSPTMKELVTSGVCSDISKRPLHQRRILWWHQIERAGDPEQLAEVFFSAARQCELPTWHDRKDLLSMIEQKVFTASDVERILAAFEGYPKIQRFLRKRILRRTLDPMMVVNLYEPSQVDWYAVRQGLAALETPKERLVKMRELLKEREDDPMGRALLVDLLLDADQVEEALSVATRLRRDELAGPGILTVLCDLQSELGMEDEARRTCSELVEYDAEDLRARAMLGDIFLRHGWYDAAYRQYKTLVDLDATNPAAQLRLAAAAAGMGKVDEALRIERRVAEGDGETGPSDPRRLARMLSAVRISRMILDAKKSGNPGEVNALERALKRTLQVSGRMNLVILVWEDYQVALDLEAKKGEDSFAVADRLRAASSGLVMLDMGGATLEGVDLSVAQKGLPVRRAVPYSLASISWNGENFQINVSDSTLPARTTQIASAKK